MSTGGPCGRTGFGHDHDGGDLHELAVERADVVGPQRAHREHVLACDRAPVGHRHTVIGDLVGVPTEPDAEHEPTARELIQRRDRLGGDDRVALRHETDPGADDVGGEKIKQHQGILRDQEVLRVF